jgi:hypothetical protein
MDQQLPRTIPYAAEQGIISSLQGKNYDEWARTGKALTTAILAKAAESA